MAFAIYKDKSFFFEVMSKTPVNWDTYFFFLGWHRFDGGGNNWWQIMPPSHVFFLRCGQLDKSNGGFVCCWQSRGSVLFFFFSALRFIKLPSTHLSITHLTLTYTMAVRTYSLPSRNTHDREQKALATATLTWKKQNEQHQGRGKNSDVATKARSHYSIKRTT